jgi:organic radical activating enzyme
MIISCENFKNSLKNLKPERKMIHYLPWSKQVLEDCISSHKIGKLPALDFEFSSLCTGACCIYCDSKPAVGEKSLNEVTADEVEKTITEGKKLGLKWIYSCGLGEPLEDPKFVRAVETAYALDIKMSTFSNGMFIPDIKTAKWLFDRNVSIILKMDSFNESRFERILGIKGSAKKVYNALDHLLSVGYGTRLANDTTRLAFSIVPNRITFDDIEEVFVFAMKHNIFPSIGELEQAGFLINDEGFDRLNITGEDMKQLKSRLDSLWGGSYCRPMCPTITTGVHINYLGDCTTDSETGLNCKWFMLKESEMRKIGSIREDSLVDLLHKTNRNRAELFEKNKDLIEENRKVDYLFGGCGGSPRNILTLAKDIVNEEKTNLCSK